MNTASHIRPYIQAATLSMALCAPGLSPARDLVVAFSPHQSPAQAKAEAKSVLNFVVDLEPGDRVTFLDGYAITSLGTFAVPTDPRYQSPKARVAKNRAGVGAVMGFAQRAKPTEAGALPVAKAVSLPKLLDHIGRNHGHGEPVDVLVLGAPYYADPREPGFAMVDGRFPSDGHLAHRRGETPFGIDDPQAYTGLRVHLATGGSSPAQHSRHEAALERWWSLFITAQGGALVSYSSDLPSVLERIRTQAQPPKRSDRVQPGNKLEMIRLRPVHIRRSIHERALSESPLPEAALESAQDVEVGLSWTGCAACDPDLDLDLYVAAKDGAKVLYFGRTETDQGVFFKDYRSSPETTGAYETVALRGAVDLHGLRVAINHFSGQAPGGVAGQVRIAVAGATYGWAFHLRSTDGNGGQGVVAALEAGRAQGPQTLLIDPLRVVGRN